MTGGKGHFALSPIDNTCHCCNDLNTIVGDKQNQFWNLYKIFGVEKVEVKPKPCTLEQ